jgi:hypothetical protein
MAQDHFTDDFKGIANSGRISGSVPPQIMRADFDPD